MCFSVSYFSLLLGYEDELVELKNQLEHLKQTVKSKVERKAYLIRLIEMRKKLDRNIFDVDTFKSYLNENLAQQIQVPLPVSFELYKINF